MVDSIRVTSLHIYPIKACGGMEVDSFRVGPRGPHMDRQWMVVDRNHRVVTQRDLPVLATMQVKLAGQNLAVQFPDSKIHHFGFQQTMGNPEEVIVWDSLCLAREVSKDLSFWLSDYLGDFYRIVRMEESFKRPVKEKWGRGELSFVDSMPILLTSQDSLEDLNQRLATPIPMDRFRPNVVVSGTKPYAEESWDDFRIGDLPVKRGKTASRCKVTTIDQASGQRSDNEPLQSLAQYKKQEEGIVFGLYLVHQTVDGMIRVGDTLSID